MSDRLTNKGITVGQMIMLSRQAYAKVGIDRKSAIKRQKDVKSMKISGRTNLFYDKSTRKWEQTGRDVKFVFMCKSEPTSYKKTDTLKTHYYPITILIHNIDKGMNSTFRLRDGSLKKPKFPGKKSDKKERIKIANYNVKNGIQMQFFFDSMFVYAVNNILFGVNWTTRPPKKRNPQNYVFLSKHSWFLFTEILPKIFTKKHLYMQKLFKNK